MEKEINLVGKKNKIVENKILLLVDDRNRFIFFNPVAADQNTPPDDPEILQLGREELNYFFFNSTGFKYCLSTKRVSCNIF